MHTAEWCNGAWPLLRHVPGPFHWFRANSFLSQFVAHLGLVQLTDIRMMPWSTEAWYVRFDDGPHTLRRFAWFAGGDPIPPAWFMLQQHCVLVAERSLRATPSSRRP